MRVSEERSDQEIADAISAFGYGDSKLELNVSKNSRDESGLQE
jgi:hypothetical protein